MTLAELARGGEREGGVQPRLGSVLTGQNRTLGNVQDLQEGTARLGLNQPGCLVPAV